MLSREQLSTTTAWGLDTMILLKLTVSNDTRDRCTCVAGVLAWRRHGRPVTGQGPPPGRGGSFRRTAYRAGGRPHVLPNIYGVPGGGTT